MAVFSAAPLAAQAPFVEARVVQVLQDEIYVDKGSDAGIHQGDLATVQRRGVEINRAQVQDLSKRSARLSLIFRDSNRLPREGDVVFFVVTARAPPKTSPDSEKKEDFVPLLVKQPAASSSENIFHGRLGFRRLMRFEPGGNNYDVTRVTSDGSGERLFGKAWSAVWFADVTKNDGPVFETQGNDEARLTVLNASLERAGENGGFFRLGRFFPRELPAIGYVDGIQPQWRSAGGFAAGAALGFRPRRSDLAATSDEPVGSVYTSIEAGQRRHLYYSSTLGGYLSYFDKKADRRAVFFDQSLELGPKLTASAQMELDFNSHATTDTTGTAHLTRLNASGSWMVFRPLTFRGGVDHYQPIDTRAERTSLGAVDPSFFQQVTRRSWAGAGLALPFRFRLDGELAWLRTSGQTGREQWRANLTKSGLPFLRDSQAGAAAYSFYEADRPLTSALGYVSLSFFRSRMILYGSYGERQHFNQDRKREWKTTDTSVRVDLRPVSSFSLHGGLTHTYAVESVTDLWDAGVDWRW